MAEGGDSMANEARREPEESVGDVLDRAGRRLTTGLVIAGALVGAGLYWRPAPPRYDAFAVGGKVVRVDTKTGSMVACDGARCAWLHRRGQDIDRRSGGNLLAPAAPAAAPLPAPAAAAQAPSPPKAPAAPAP